jgi:hypothetical protein
VRARRPLRLDADELRRLIARGELKLKPIGTRLRAKLKPKPKLGRREHGATEAQRRDRMRARPSRPRQ